MVLCGGEHIADLVPGYTYLYIILFENTYIYNNNLYFISLV